MGVVSLYSNIPHKDGLEALRRFLNSGQYNTPLHPDLVIKLAEFILTHNYFLFKDEFFLQVKGTAMGTRMVPQYANLFMADLENTVLEKSDEKPELYGPFIDDICTLWVHGIDELTRFAEEFTRQNPSIRLTVEYSRNDRNFLDTKLSIRNGKIETSVYKKPTDRFTLLHPNSFHPPL